MAVSLYTSQKYGMACGMNATQSRLPGLLRLPVELREHIYDHYLESLQPTTFILAKDVQRSSWTIFCSPSRHAPALLLVCGTISIEFARLLSLRLSLGLVSRTPLSFGPTVKIEPRWRAPDAGSDRNRARCIQEAEIPAVLTPILTKTAPSMRLHLVMPQSPADAELFTKMLCYIVAVCNSRSKPLKQVNAVRDPVTGPGWAADIDAIAREVSGIPCDNMEWANWYRQWYSSESSNAVRQEGDDPRHHTAHGVQEAWEAVVESCRADGGFPWL